MKAHLLQGSANATSSPKRISIIIPGISELFKRNSEAIQNFWQDGQSRIKISIGDRLNIAEEIGEWYFGCLSTNKNVRGIFPKSYVHLTRSSELQGHGNHDLGFEKKLLQGILSEIVLVLREWSPIWKQLYMKRDENVMKIKDMMCDLISYRKIALSERIPKHQYMELRCLIASTIDVGNKMLGLDMVLRNEEGNSFPVEVTSAMRLFMEHEIASERVRYLMDTNNWLSVKSEVQEEEHDTYTLLASFMNFIGIFGDDLEIVMTLYDFVTECPVSDNFVFLWKSNILPEETEKLQQLKVLFTDLILQDITQRKICMVCYAVRIGSVEQRKSEYVQTLVGQAKPMNDQEIASKQSQVKCKRRPFGIAAVDISSYLKVSAEDSKEDHIFLPFLRYSDGTMKSLISRIINMKEKAVEECAGQGLWFSLKLFNRNFSEVVALNNLRMSDVTQSHKIGFPEVMTPSYVRNEFYLTLIKGEFYKFLAPDKNIEVAVSVCSERGKIMPGAIQMGNNYLKEYRSIIYYRASQPEWYETVKIVMPLSGFKDYHLKFIFTHRSANLTAEKPFAVSYINIVNEYGTPIKDGKYTLNMFMIDPRKFEEDSCSYLSLPAMPGDINMKKCNVKGLKSSEKNRFFIQTYVCSTKITQNVNLLRLLDWVSGEHDVLERLEAFLKVDGSEMVTFLQDILDVLFKILEEELGLESIYVTAFDCLVHVLDIFSNEKFKHFLPVLNVYIEERFSAPLVYKKLITILKLRLANSSLCTDVIAKILRSLHYYGSFILRSWKLCIKIQGEKDADEFILSMKDLINTLVTLCCSEGLGLQTQRDSLKYIYPFIFNFEVTLNSEELATECCNQCLKLEKLIRCFDTLNARDNIMIMNEMVQSKIFLLPKCRLILIPPLLEKIMEYLHNKLEVELCVSCLCCLLEPSQPMDVQDPTRNASELMLPLLDYVIETIITLERGSLVTGKLLALMIEILRQMPPENFVLYKDYFDTDDELLDFLMALLIFFKEVVLRPFFCCDWLEMIMLQSSVILKALKCIASIMKDKFLEQFNGQIWTNYFHCAMEFVTQSFLQLESFPEKKCSQILWTYGDMRQELAYVVKDMWSSMGEYQRSFIPSLVGPFLEMALIPNSAIQETIIPIFYDMTHCDFYSVELEIVSYFDMLIEDGKGDEDFKERFCSILNLLFERDEPMKKEGFRFLNEIKNQLEKLLEYRYHIRDDCSDNGVVFLYQLLDFYSERNNKQLYVRYVRKLFEWHKKYGNHAEAAKTLTLHAELLDWSHNEIPPALRYYHHPMPKTCFELKEFLYSDIIKYFDHGRAWSCAIKYCKELADIYEYKAFNYSKLADVLRQKSIFFDKIMASGFPAVEYFYVSYSGSGFPPFLQNKAFVYRGNDYEGYPNFCSRIRSQFPKAHLKKELHDNSRSTQQSIRIIKVFPAIDNRKELDCIPERILYHLHEHDNKRFSFTSSFKMSTEHSSNNNQCSSGVENTGLPFTSKGKLRNWNSRTIVETSHSFPWCLKLSPVTSLSTYEISHLQASIEEILAVNRSLIGILPVEANVSQNFQYVCFKLNEIMSSSSVKELTKQMKGVVEEHQGDLDLLNQLQSLLIKQINLVSVFIQNNDSVDFNQLHSLPKLLHYLKKCVKKLNIALGSRGKQNSLVQIEPNDDKRESDEFSLLRGKARVRHSQKPQSYHEEFFESREGNSLWYVPSPSYKLNAGNRKFIFHGLMPVTASLSAQFPPLCEGILNEPSSDSSSGSSKNELANNRISVQNSQVTVDYPKRHESLAVESHEKLTPGKQTVLTSIASIDHSKDYVVDAPPPLPPKAHDYISPVSDAASSSHVHN